MVKININPELQKSVKGNRMISGRESAKLLKISNSVFFTAAKCGDIQPQIEVPIGKKKVGYFELSYINEISSILPKRREKGFEIFTPQIKEQLKPINERWKNRVIKWIK